MGCQSVYNFAESLSEHRVHTHARTHAPSTPAISRFHGYVEVFCPRVSGVHIVQLVVAVTLPGPQVGQDGCWAMLWHLAFNISSCAWVSRSSCIRYFSSSGRHDQYERNKITFVTSLAKCQSHSIHSQCLQLGV
eukprot:6078888-Amphidinium_carterae.1